MTTLSLPRPDDWHIHLRDGAALATTVADCARRFARAAVMPNLSPPVTTVTEALAYRQRILEVLPEGLAFEPLMTLYLTDRTTAAEVRLATESGLLAAKLYPAGATTNAEAGVTAVERIYPVFAAMEKQGLPLMVHGEVTAPEVDIFDREARFIDTVLAPLIAEFPALRVVLEHVSTATAVAFIEAAPERVGATITAHHLLLNRNAMLAGGIRPHHYCLPVVKRETDRQALLRAATSGNPKFFLGTDSAPHGRERKQSACGCAGIYTAHAAIELYAEAFEQAGALERLEGFASRFGAEFYGLPRNHERITLTRRPWQVPNQYALGDETLVPFRAGEHIAWQISPVAGPSSSPA